MDKWKAENARRWLMAAGVVWEFLRRKPGHILDYRRGLAFKAKKVVNYDRYMDGLR